MRVDDLRSKVIFIKKLNGKLVPSHWNDCKQLLMPEHLPNNHNLVNTGDPTRQFTLWIWSKSTMMMMADTAKKALQDISKSYATRFRRGHNF